MEDQIFVGAAHAHGVFAPCAACFSFKYSANSNQVFAQLYLLNAHIGMILNPQFQDIFGLPAWQHW